MPEHTGLNVNNAGAVSSKVKIDLPWANNLIRFFMLKIQDGNVIVEFMVVCTRVQYLEPTVDNAIQNRLLD